MAGGQSDHRKLLYRRGSPKVADLRVQRKARPVALKINKPIYISWQLLRIGDFRARLRQVPLTYNQNATIMLTARHLLSIGICLLLAFAAQAQNSSWQSKFDNGADFIRYESKDGKYIIGTTKKDACVLDGHTGKTLWAYRRCIAVGYQ